MATTTQKYQILQKVSAEDNILIHPETDAGIVKYDNTTSQLNATDVKGALDELKENLDAVTGGGTVTGVKGEAEETYRTGQVTLTKANLGLGNVDDTSDMDKPVSTAQQAAIEDAIAGLTDGTTPAGKADKLSNARTISVAGDVTGSASFDGSADAQIQTTLKNSGVTAGTYSAVTVDAKGIVTAGAQSIEVGASGQGTPSASLAIGGLFFKML